jgi:eukaryotic-like serine/threonine-protein kinase
VVTAVSQSNPSSNQFNPWIGRLIGNPERYRLDQRLGSGGMGEVFLATDTRLGKPVALKLLKESLAIAEDLELKERFERECSICAALKSPHIVQVSDYGVTTEGYPFYVMEYLHGQTLGEILSIHPRLTVERTCNIMTQVCAGLQLAHEGITLWAGESTSTQRIKVVHRDLKPANIFLTPTALGELVKVIDFGIAKIHSLQAEYATTTNVFLGTCHYAPPEQFNRYGEVDERSDIYSLGVILYEMLTGVDPFGLKFKQQRISNDAWLTAHASKAVLPLRSQPDCEHLSPALEAVVMRCLEKKPADRFASVSELSQALQASSVGLSADQETVVRSMPAASLEATHRHSNSGNLAHSDNHQPINSHNTSLSNASFPNPSHPDKTTLPVISAPAKSAAKSPASQIGRSLGRLLVGGGAVLSVALGVYLAPRWLSPAPTGGSPIIAVAEDHQFTLAETLTGNTGAVWSAVLNPTDQTLISAGEDRSAGSYPIKVWDLQTKQVRQTLEQHTKIVRSLSVSENNLLASGSDDNTIKVWDLSTRKLLQTLSGHSAPVWSVMLNPDGQTLVSGSADKTVRVWDLRTGSSRVLEGHSQAVYSVALSLDGKTIASGSEDKTIKLWDVATGELIRTLGEPGGHRETVRAVAFSPDGTHLASAGWDDFVKLWNAETGQLLQTYQGHTDRAVSVAFVNDQMIVSGSDDRTIRTWDVETGQAIQTLPAHADWVLSVSPSTDAALVSSSSDTTVKIWR